MHRYTLTIHSTDRDEEYISTVQRLWRCKKCNSLTPSAAWILFLIWWPNQLFNYGCWRNRRTQRPTR